MASAQDIRRNGLLNHEGVFKQMFSPFESGDNVFCQRAISQSICEFGDLPVRKVHRESICGLNNLSKLRPLVAAQSSRLVEVHRIVRAEGIAYSLRKGNRFVQCFIR